MIITKIINGVTYASDGQWYEVECIDSSDDETITGFNYNGQWHDLNNYIKTRSNAWNNEPEHYKNGLHARDITSYYKPCYIEIDDSGDAVRVYEED